ncbi:MAG: sigma-70 family RNA polymerase sigma factor [Bacillota bacterium]|nr:sigma-70 family RNA polymerase sigma factor [Bacillota bacterium]MDW7684758.1 sigma-70 family RNA polymerase sigma factor [Bacillota bacterium]
MYASQDTNQYIKNALDKYSDMVFRLAFSNLKNKYDAEDIAQNVFIKLMENRANIQSAEHEKAWLIRVTINLCKNQLKASRFRISLPVDETIAAPKDDKEEVLAEVLSLPLKYRNVIHLYYYEGYSVSEISDILGSKENTVSSWLFRARKMLKTKLEGGFGDE